jgi:hypothetical protein
MVVTNIVRDKLIVYIIILMDDNVYAASQEVCGWVQLLIGKGVNRMHTLVGMYNN